jgi:hypothetical protein
MVMLLCESQSEDTRSRLLQADQALIQTEESAYNSKRMLAESEAIGQEVCISIISVPNRL